MSKAVTSKPVTTLTVRQQKGKTPLVMLTAYDALTATLLDESVDMLLVGDSLGMVRYGMASTLSVTLEMMILHGRAVAQASRHACVIVDMPFGSYQESPQQAFRNAARIMAETDAQAVKLEGGEEMSETIHYLTQRGIPVMAHIGLTPQYVQKFGGFRVQGRDDASRAAILADAKAIADAGAFSVVVEGVPTSLGDEITQAIDIPTIGIGASAGCDGQVLVLEDMLGLTPRAPKFVKHYANLAEEVQKAAQSYAEEVRNRSFPAKEHCYE